MALQAQQKLLRHDDNDFDDNRDDHQLHYGWHDYYLHSQAAYINLPAQQPNDGHFLDEKLDEKIDALLPYQGSIIPTAKQSTQQPNRKQISA